MQEKTIGSFISALRRANGMTQKELAERLNVSDKTVSRWERDDGAPDLTLIPVIAEVFGVTCDELLRGERRQQEPTLPQECPATEDGTPPLSAKATKQAQYLLHGARVSYTMQSMIVTLLYLVALIAAMIANSVFHRAYLGFLLSTAVIVAADFWQAIAMLLTNFATSADMLGAEMLGTAAHGEFRYWVHKTAWRNAAIGLLVFAFTLPLVLFVTDSHKGLSMSYWVGYGICTAFLASIPTGMFVWFLRRHTLNRLGAELPEKTGAVIRHNHRLQRTVFAVTAGVVCLTAVLHLIVSQGQNPRAFADGIVFNDIEAFCAFMEEDVSDDEEGTFFTDHEEITVCGDETGTTVANPIGIAEYFNELGERISEEEALTRHIYDHDGNIAATYIARNDSVMSFTTGADVTPITVYTYEAYQAGQTQLTLINAVFIVVYVLEYLTAVVIYFFQRKKVI